MKYVCKDCIYLSYGRYCNRTYKKDKEYYGWVSLAEYSCNGKCKYYKKNTFFYKIKKHIDKLLKFLYNPKILKFFKSQKTKKMIIIKTQMKSSPLTCQDCQIHLLSAFHGDFLIGCPLLKNWLTPEEIKDGKNKFSDCPLEDINEK